jgi:hypothetical protein
VRGYCENRNELIHRMYVAQSRQQAPMEGTVNGVGNTGAPYRGGVLLIS